MVSNNCRYDKIICLNMVLAMQTVYIFALQNHPYVLDDLCNKWQYNDQ